MKRNLYHLHYRQDFTLLVIDAFQYHTDYYNVDYVFLFTNPPPIFSAYLSKKGLREASNLTLKRLLHNRSWKQMFVEGRKRFSTVDRIRKQFVGRVNIQQRIQRIELIFLLFYDLGKSYFYTDGTSLAGVEKHSSKPGVYRMLKYIGHYKIEAHKRLSILEDMLIREVQRLGRQLHISSKLLLMHSVDEFRKGAKSLFRNIPQAVRAREHGYVLLQRGGRWVILTGPAFQSWKRRLLPAGDEREVYGRVAYQVPYVVRGRVRRHFSFTYTTRLEAGEIIVTGMTNPQMFPMLKRAKGIVTDEGGLMCHAAIVSRELKKPCIVGTKEATQVFRDGDVIEMDTRRGIVRKIVRSGDRRLASQVAQNGYGRFVDAARMR
ncbi:MAG: PEP-utilizing enzyme [Candidatus Kerfeldbacteria bacterium]